jgi:hypothetical protein
MLHFNSEEKERMLDELHRTPRSVRPAPWVLLTPLPDTSPAPTPPKPKLTLVPKSKL